VLESAGDGIVGVGFDGRVMFANPAAAGLFGAEPASILGRPLSELVGHPNGPKSGPFPADRVPTDRGIHRGETILQRSLDGASIPAEWVSTPIAKGATSIGSVITIKDITQRRRTEAELNAHREHLEEMVKQRTAALMSANKELEAFSYSVSHDLRAPLRSIDGFSHALIEDYSDTLDDRGRDYLRRVRGASQRMARLIDDLLTLSRVTRTQLARAPVDLSATVRGIVAELRAAEPQRQVELLVKDDLVVQGDDRLLRLALQNLVGNAWKFTSRHEKATIEFGASYEKDRLVYHVRDDGAGFDMSYANKLFGAFQRLHSADEFEGTGIGLATVQRVIRQHGGSVWAEGAVERGSSFFFTINEIEVPT
jgi:PAS domain S-box-containing protein